MRASGCIWAIAFLVSTALSTETLPFVPAAEVESSRRAFEVLQILKRSNNCPSGYNPCGRLGDANACCIDGTNCSRDAANNIACCPTGASCTGSLTSESTATGSSFMFPQTVTATTTSAAAGVITGSTLSGAYPFIYVPTTFSNAAICSSYYSLCQSEYTQCTVALMGRYGVTVGGPGGAGTTVEAVTATPQATSICSSLSVAACHGLQLGYCGAVETQSANANGANGVAAAPGRTSSLHDLALGLAVGVGGLFI